MGNYSDMAFEFGQSASAANGNPGGRSASMGGFAAQGDLMRKLEEWNKRMAEEKKKRDAQGMMQLVQLFTMLAGRNKPMQLPEGYGSNMGAEFNDLYGNGARQQRAQPFQDLYGEFGYPVNSGKEY